LKVASKYTPKGWGRRRITLLSFSLGTENSNQIVTDHAEIIAHPMRQLIVNLRLLSPHGTLKLLAKTGGYRPVAC